MKGHIRRRGKRSWEIKYDVGTVAGDRITKYETIRGGKRDAQRALNAKLHEIDTGTLVEPNKITVGEYLESWLVGRKPTVSAKTYERYAEIVRKHLIPTFGQTILQQLSAVQIEAAYARWHENGRQDGRGGLSARTIHHHHARLKQALKHAVRKNLLRSNPADMIDNIPKVQTIETPVLDEDQLGALLRTAKSTRLFAPVLLAATTGMRRGEILGLRWADVNLSSAQLYVARVLEQTRAGLGFKEPKTKHSRRTIALPSVTVQMLRDHKVKQAEERLSLGLGRDQNDLVFTTLVGGPVNPRNFSKLFDRLVARAGVTRITFHGLRHTHFTHLLKAGTNPKVVSERAGHATVAITLSIYAHVLPGMQEDVAVDVDRSVRGMLGSET